MKSNDQQELALAKTHSKVQEALNMSNKPDKELLERFAEMRTTALNSIPQTAPRSHWFYTLPSVGVAAALVLVVMLGVFPAKTPGLSVPMDSLDLLTEAEDMEMLEVYDVEFYVWLEREIDLPKG